jgi:hypothetical protein
VGVGWQAAEYEAAGLDFSGRGPLLDQALEVCQALWSQPKASYSGDDLAFEGIHAMPKPVSGDGVPIWVSGTVNRRTARRLARFGMGWIPWGDDRADITGGITRMRSLLAEMGLGHDGFQVQGPVRMVQDSDGTVDLQSTMAGIPDLVESGVTDCRLALRLSPEPEEAADLLGRAVEAFRSAVGRDA